MNDDIRADPIPKLNDRARRYKWDLRYLRMAKEVASWSKDPSTQTGAVLVDANGRPRSFGFNGFAQGVEDRLEWYTNRDIKYKAILHCEENAYIFAKHDATGCTLYTWPFMSCAHCAAVGIQCGLARHVAPIGPPDKVARWADSFALSQQQFDDAGVEVTLYDEGLLSGEP